MVDCSTKIRLLILTAGIVLLIDGIAKTSYSGLAMTQSVRQLSIRRVVKEQGWEIIGLKQSRIVRVRQILESYGEKPARIYFTAFKPNREIVVDIPLYRLLEGGEVLSVKDQSISVRSIVQYDVDKKIFCYSVQGVGAFYDKKSGYGGYGGEYGFLFYDNDGDGKFESFEMGGHIPPFIPKVPNWILH